VPALVIALLLSDRWGGACDVAGRPDVFCAHAGAVNSPQINATKSMLETVSRSKGKHLIDLVSLLSEQVAQSY
jgi:hypothetical protein